MPLWEHGEPSFNDVISDDCDALREEYHPSTIVWRRKSKFQLLKLVRATIPHSPPPFMGIRYRAKFRFVRSGNGRRPGKAKPTFPSLSANFQLLDWEWFGAGCCYFGGCRHGNADRKDVLLAEEALKQPRARKQGF